MAATLTMPPMSPLANSPNDARTTSTPLSGRRTFKEKLLDDINAAEASNVQEVMLGKPADRSSLSIACLVEGYPQAFVDFFTLTHTGENDTGLPSAEELVAQGVDPSTYVVSEYDRMERLRLVRNQLVVADAARRGEDRQGTYEAYNNLAHYFEEHLYVSKAIYFYEKCVEIAGNDWPEGEMAATLSLGLACEKLGQVENAIKHHERHLEIASAHDSEHAMDQRVTANRNLVHTYGVQAKKLETNSEMESAVEVLQKMLSCGHECGEMDATADANYRLGMCHQQQDQHEKALEFYREFLHLCSTLGDKVGEGRAYCEIAKCLQTLGHRQGAIENLEHYLELSKAMDPHGQARAYCLLGNIYHQDGNFESAVSYFEKFFEVARTLQDRPLLDIARVNLGVARGMANMEGFMTMVNGDLSALLQWKNIRLPF
mmetsp:Transcript_40277/g.114029  ORF Transcript_40277/g.114029 Transcript_40277/m.114029 type:complete len:430 (-) Transcript_40277:386-1675(-)